ncbi:hypothetical protein D3P07_11620 [Paenibacillus sp. 1011MAR3C5]|uniref:hypothetical protein n=1 Tax=Paenibacillus sp. 1011MAR3C5 TaxID=1675787 RepID=UPI000E6BCDDE|nr:hypothetical protein [Paenibacillus sp. 1011MAR3C5]RJE88635.1 hypothetical protein D3P07_11620 [Paenibacillus sp. 1011MAR3C5]
MAKLKQVIKAELDPRRPVPEIMAVIEAMIVSNPGHEGPILLGVYDAVQTALDRMTKKGGVTNGK